MLAVAAALLVTSHVADEAGQDTTGERKDGVSHTGLSPADDARNFGRFASGPADDARNFGRFLAEFPAAADEQRNQFVSASTTSPEEALEEAQSDLEQALATF